MSPAHRSARLVDRRTMLAGLGLTGAAAGLLLLEPAFLGSSSAGAKAPKKLKVAADYDPPVGVNTFDTTYGVYNWKTTNTRRHAAALTRVAGGGQASEVFIGDSLTAGCIGGTSFDRLNAWPRIYSRTLVELGYPNGGTGLVRAVDATTSDARWSFDGSWHSLDSCGYSLAAGASATFTANLTGGSVAVVFQRGSGAGAFTISVDGATSGAGWRAVPAGGSTAVARTVLTGLANDVEHTVTITASTARPVYLIGVEVFRSHGLSCHNVAQSGSRAAGTGEISWSDVTTDGGVMQLLTLYNAESAAYGVAPSAVHCALGTNDIAIGTDPATVVAALTAIQAATPGCDFFLYLCPQPAEIDPDVWATYGTALYALADALDVPLFDLEYVLGGYAVEKAAGLVGDDVAHLDDAGYAIWGKDVAEAAVQ